MKKIIFTMLFLVFAMTATAKEKYAVIISARSGDQLLSDTNLKYVRDTQKILDIIKVKNITTFFEGGNESLAESKDITTEGVLNKLEELSKKMKEDDELWIFLYGHANLSRRGISIPTNTKRLKGTAILEKMDKIKGRQLIFCFNTQSSAFMDLFTKKNRIIVTATNGIGQLNPPVFPKYFLNSWIESPKNSLLKNLQISAERTTEYFEKNSIGVSEKAQVFDGENLFSSPFNELKTDNAIAEVKFSEDEIVSSTLDDIALDINDIAEIEDKSIVSKDAMIIEANEETKNLMKLAKRTLKKYKYAIYKSFYLFRNIEYTINKDFSNKSKFHTTVYINDESEVENYATMIFDDEPPLYEVEINNIRMIFPDGKWRKAETRTTYGKDNRNRYQHIKFPGLQKGCIVEFDYSYTTTPNFQIPEFHNTYILQRRTPVLKTAITIKSPKDLYFNHKLYRIKAKPIVSESNYSKILKYNFDEILPLEPLAYDPPTAEIAIKMQISSLHSWKDFENWVKRILKGSDIVDEKTADFAKHLTANAKTDTEKVKKIYEFLCELRYETTPMGARAFKPRLPSKVCFERYGDCKDKANALVVLAKVVGVKGHLVLLNRSSATDKDFPAWQFNHAIAYFPKLEGYPNGLWCDATDGATPFATLPPGDVGRDAFVLEDDGAKFRTVNLANNAINSYNQNIEIIVNKDNSASGKVAVNATGLSDYELRQIFKRLTPLQAKSYFQRITDDTLFGINLKNISISSLHNLDIPISIKGDFEGFSYKLIKNKLALPDDLWTYVSAAKRDRPLQINDGQPLRLSQTVIVKNDNSMEDYYWSNNSEFLDTNIKIIKTDNGWKQIIVIEFKKTTITEEEYPKLRKQILEFYSNMR